METPPSDSTTPGSTTPPGSTASGKEPGKELEEKPADGKASPVSPQHQPQQVEPEEQIPEEAPAGPAAKLKAFLRKTFDPPAAPKGNGSRDRLKQDRSKTFLLLGGAVVLMSLLFVALFSSPSSKRKSDSEARRNQPNLGRPTGADNSADTNRSVTPLLNADTRRSAEDGAVTAADIRNTAKPRPEPAKTEPPQAVLKTQPTQSKDYALNKIDFPADPAYPGTAPGTANPTGPAPSAPPAQALPVHIAKASLVFVRNSAGTAERDPFRAPVQPAISAQPSEFLGLPAGSRLVARLETPVSSALKIPAVASIEYNYERNGEIVVPAGSKAFGELEQANEQGFVGIRFRSILFPDESERRLDGRAMSLTYEPLRGTVTGRGTALKFLVQALTGLGTIAAATVGTGTGTGVNNTISNNVLLRERLANNIALGGDQELSDLASHRNVVVTVPGNTRFYIVLSKPDKETAPRAAPVPATGIPGSGPAPSPEFSAQELRELQDLKRALNGIYQQPPQALPPQTQADVRQRAEILETSGETAAPQR